MVTPLGESDPHNGAVLGGDTPSGVPHASTKDHVYNGFFIPKGRCSFLPCNRRLTVRQLNLKGTIMVANAWYVVIFPVQQRFFLLKCLRAVLHDPDLYPDPEEFRPERFLNEDGTFRDDPMMLIAFGVGKRICPGRHFVDLTLFIVVSSVLSVFNVTKAKDENGREIPVNVATSAETEVIV